MQLSDRLFQKKLLKERKILEKVQRTANKKEREYLFVEKLLQRVKVKILAFFCKQSYNNYKEKHFIGKKQVFVHRNIPQIYIYC